MGLNDPIAVTNVFDGTIVNVTSFNGVENENITVKKKAFHQAWRQENQKQVGMLQKEVKKCVIASCTPKIRISTNATREIVGLKGVW
jgi:hypothetical protein